MARTTDYARVRESSVSAGKPSSITWVRSSIARNTLADANATRDWRIYGDFAQRLIGTPGDLRRRGARARSQDTCTRSMPPRSICVSRSFPGRVPYDQSGGEAAHAAGLARQYPLLHLHQRGKAARRQYPRSVRARARCLYVMDRGYIDFERLYVAHQAGSFFVIRAKTNSCRRRYSRAVDRSTGSSRADRRARRHYSPRAYPAPLRRISFRIPRPTSDSCSSPTTSRCRP